MKRFLVLLSHQLIYKLQVNRWIQLKLPIKIVSSAWSDIIDFSHLSNQNFPIKTQNILTDLQQYSLLLRTIVNPYILFPSCIAFIKQACQREKAKVLPVSTGRKQFVLSRAKVRSRDSYRKIDPLIIQEAEKAHIVYTDLKMQYFQVRDLSSEDYVSDFFKQNVQRNPYDWRNHQLIWNIWRLKLNMNIAHKARHQ